MLTLISNTEFITKVSSVLNRDVKLFGKQYLFDGCDDTCWNSDQGTPQWIMLQFASTIALQKFEIQFQGGFAAKSICLQKNSSAEATKQETINTFFPEDINSVQTFSLAVPLLTNNLKFLFPESTDTNFPYDAKTHGEFRNVAYWRGPNQQQLR